MSRAIYFLVLTMGVLGTEGQVEDDSCNVNGVSGICKNILQCPPALRDLQKKISPQICRFDDTVPVVCCIEKATSVPPAPPPSPAPAPSTTVTVTTSQKPAVATSRPPSVSTTTEYTPEYNDYIAVDEPAPCAPLPSDYTAPKTGRKAWDKCIEYQEQYVYPCQDSVALTGGKVRGNNCKHNVNQLVINGIDAGSSEFPHMALLGYGEASSISFQCGGSIVSENFILTAGHCTYAKGFGAVTFALVGTLRRSDDYDQDNLYGIRKIHKHLQYAPPKRYHDIALLETERSIKMSVRVIPACLDIGNQPAPEALATGWGALANGSNADVLQKVKIFKFSDLECKLQIPSNRHLKEGIDTRTQMCFGDRRESKDTCQGDSGGPLQINSARLNCMYVVIGVTSFGRKCGVVGEPGVYVRVSEYAQWIESVVWP